MEVRGESPKGMPSAEPRFNRLNTKIANSKYSELAIGLVEVRGIEPRSEIVNLQTSTCLVTDLISQEAGPSNQATSSYSVKCSRKRNRKYGYAILFGMMFSPALTGTKPGEQTSQLTLLIGMSNYCQLHLFP